MATLEKNLLRFTSGRSMRMAKLGKELYGTGVVFWSALLFDTLRNVDRPDVLCLSLDVPSVELKLIPPADQRRYLLYNHSQWEGVVRPNDGGSKSSFALASQMVSTVGISRG